MVTLTADKLDDLVVGTLDNLGRGQLIQIAQEYPDTPTYSQFFQKGRHTFSGGTGIDRTIMDRLSNSAEFVGLFEVDETSVVPLLRRMRVPWRHATANWTYELREMMMNRGDARVNEIIKPRRAATMINLLELIERKLWAVPATGDEKNMYGIPYWLVANATTGFNGGHPKGDDGSAYSDIAGLDVATATTYQNYTFQYENISKPDFIKKWRTAVRNTNWKTPKNIQQFVSFDSKYAFYMDEATLSTFEDIGESQNENLGRDLASMDDQIVFKRSPLVWVPYLDTLSAKSGWIYGVNHDTLHAVSLAGDYMRETGPDKVAKQHNAREVFIDLTVNTLCLDRRRNMVITPTSATL